MRRKSFEVRKKIVHNYCTKNGITVRKLAKRYKTTHKTISQIVQMYGNTTALTGLPKTGREEGASNPELDKKLLALIKRNPCMVIRDWSKIGRSSVGKVQRVNSATT